MLLSDKSKKKSSTSSDRKTSKPEPYVTIIGQAFRSLALRGAMLKTSAGILMYRRINNVLEVFLIHPGGPYFRNKDNGAWSIPKGEINEGEDPLAAARREFQEETGCRAEGQFLPLGQVRQKGGKVVFAWAVEGSCRAESITSNEFTLEWPPGSGRMQKFPEADRAGWFMVAEAVQKINVGQAPVLDRLLLRVASQKDPAEETA
jgi:predicted NUDIX family NTP pyrophosphohydrolase